jgi:hypothetical protein
MRARLWLLGALVIALVLVAPTVASAGGGNSDGAKACQQGGWQTLHRSDGSSFKNAGDCTSYAAQGGAFAAQTSLTVSGVFDGVDSWAITITGSGLYPGSEVTIYVCNNDYDCGWPPGTVASDGSFSSTFVVHCAGDSDHPFYFVVAFGTTASGEPIESNQFLVPCL